MLQSYKQLEVSHNELMNGQTAHEQWKQQQQHDENRIIVLQNEVNELMAANSELVAGNTALESQLKDQTANFDRDPNQGSLELEDLSKNEGQQASKEKRFLLSELTQIKEQLHSKLLMFKARSAGKRNTSQAVENGQFEILDHMTVEDILRKEIDHFFIMT